MERYDEVKAGMKICRRELERSDNVEAGTEFYTVFEEMNLSKLPPSRRA